MTLLRRMRYALAPFLLVGLRLWRCVAPQPGGLRILIFHDTLGRKVEELGRFVSPLADSGCLVSPETAAARLSAPPEDTAATAYLLTFDDGLASNLEAARELARRGIKAIFFVCPGLVDLAPAEQRQAIADNIFAGRVRSEALDPATRLLTWAEIGEIQKLGHTIGAHGMTHQRLTALSGDALKTEIERARSVLEANTGGKVDWYAYSFGDIDSISAQALRIISQTYAFCRSGVRGLNAAGTGRWALRAEEIDLLAPASYRALVSLGGLDMRYRDARRRLDGLLAESPSGMSR